MKACGMERYADWFFDLDGTLVDSAPDILRLLAGVLREEGLGTPEPDKRRIGPPLEDIILGLCPGLSPERLDRVVRVYRGRYRACPFDGSPAFAGIPPLFERLAARGCRLFVATNKPEDVTRRLLETRGLSPVRLRAARGAAGNGAGLRRRGCGMDADFPSPPIPLFVKGTMA